MDLRRNQPYNFDLRFTACNWVTDNLEHNAKLIPQSHPRAFVEFQTAPITISAMAISALAIAVTVGIAFLLSEIPQCPSISAMRSSIRKSTQIEFLYLLLLGLFFVPAGALLLACKPSKGTCITSVWMINVGYTLALVPTLVRVLGIIKVVQAGKKFHWVKVDKKEILKTSIGITIIAAVLCAL